MPNPIPVTAPAGFAPVSAIGFAEADSSLSPVSALKPLPVMAVSAPVAAPLAGSAGAAVMSGPFAPVSGKPIMLTLTGTWTGTVRVLRSVDGGTTKLPLTVGGLPWAALTANCCEPVWEEAASDAVLYLDLAIASGSVAYRLGQ
jgi:hypothetical protein